MRTQVLRAALAVAAVILIMGGLALGWSRRQLVAQNQAELFRQAEAAGRLIETQIADLPLREIPRSTFRLLEEVRLVGGHDFVEAALIGRGIYRPLLDDPALLPQLPELSSDRRIFEVEVAGEPVLAAARLVDVVQTDNATLRLLVVIGRSDPLLDPATVTRPLLLAVLVGAIAAVAIAVGVARRFGRRVERLAQAAAGLASGDPSVRAPAEGDDEIARLGEAFNEMAERLFAARTREREFLMSVGHDLRTPLTTIRGYAEALDAGTVRSDDLARVAGVLHRQTDRLSRLIEDLMLLARLEAREFTLRPEEVDLTAHLREVVEAHRPRAVAAGVSLESDLSEVGRVMLDPDRVSQILGNLIDNALRYTPDSGRVAVSLRDRGRAVAIEVADTGTGIEPEDLPRVFERLYVSQKYRPLRAEGSGLGLSIVRELVSALGGEATAASTPGRGTTVTVVLPRSTPAGVEF